MNDPLANLAPEQRVKALQAIGAVAMGLAALASALLGDRWPWVHGVTVFISWGVGKLLGTPIAPVVRSAFKSMPPAAQADLSVHAVASLPPGARQGVIDRIAFLASDPPPPMPPAPPMPPMPVDPPDDLP